MTRHPITKHGRDHRPNGADPIDAIFFNYPNDSGTGGYLEATTHNYTSFVNDGNAGITLTDSGTAGVAVNSSSQIQVLNGGSGGITIEQSATAPNGIFITDLSGSGLFLFSDYLAEIDSGGAVLIRSTAAAGPVWGVSLTADYGPIVSYAPNSQVQERIGTSAGEFWAVMDNVPNVFMSVSSTEVVMNVLPTSNPGGSGRLWNSGGVVHIT